jgi:hypothetical protein
MSGPSISVAESRSYKAEVVGSIPTWGNVQDFPPVAQLAAGNGLKNHPVWVRIPPGGFRPRFNSRRKNETNNRI